MRWNTLLNWTWFLTFAFASSAWCLTAADCLSATFDEPTYLTRGLEHWRTGSYGGLLKLGTMPLAIDVQTLPLSLWERWTGQPFDLDTDFATPLAVARAGTLFFWWLLLFYAWRCGHHLAGDWGARLAVALIAFEPSLLAHASLATTDIALTACLLLLVYHFRVGRDGPSWKRVGVPMLCYGVAILAKASALVFGPLCLLAVEVERRFREPGAVRVRAFLGDLAVIVPGGLALAFLYCGSDWKPEPSFVKWAHALPETSVNRSLAWLADNLCIFSNAGVGIVRQIKHNLHGHGMYLLGEQHPRGVWYYFPVALCIKTSLPLLLLPLVLLAVRPRAFLNWAGVAAIAVLIFSLTCRVQIGVRFFLPFMVFAAIGAAAGVARVCRRGNVGVPASAGLLSRRPAQAGTPTKTGILGALTAGGIVWTAITAFLVWPHGLCYTNELWGGTPGGYRLLSDSNYDWGQGLGELAEWQRQSDIPAMQVWYFGSDPRLGKLPMEPLQLSYQPLEGPEDVAAQVRGRHVAVSVSLLYGMLCDTPAHRHAVRFFRGERPVARTTTFFIYDFTGANKEGGWN